MSAMVRSEIGAAVRAAQRPDAVQPRPAERQRDVVRLWLPLTPLWILLAPFALMACPLMALVPATRGVPPLRAALAVGAVLISLSGTQVDVETPRALVRIRLF